MGGKKPPPRISVAWWYHMGSYPDWWGSSGSTWVFGKWIFQPNGWWKVWESTPRCPEKFRFRNCLPDGNSFGSLFSLDKAIPCDGLKIQAVWKAIFVKIMNCEPRRIWRSDQGLVFLFLFLPLSRGKHGTQTCLKSNRFVEFLFWHESKGIEGWFKSDGTAVTTVLNLWIYGKLNFFGCFSASCVVLPSQKQPKQTSRNW